MAGLSVVLEGQEGANTANNSSNILNKISLFKTNMVMIIKPSVPSPVPAPATEFAPPCYAHHRSCGASAVATAAATATANFLDFCFLCRQKLLPGKDIYMYKGDRAFCTIVCRSKQIKLDEEENKLTRIRERMDICSLAAINTRIKATSSPPSYMMSSSSSPSKPRHHHLHHIHHRRGGARNQGGGFAY